MKDPTPSQQLKRSLSLWLPVLYGLSVKVGAGIQGNLLMVPTHLNARTGTPLFETAIGVLAVLALALAVPLAGLADLPARFTHVVFAVINITLRHIKLLDAGPPAQIFVCPGRVPVSGLVSTIGLLLPDRLAR